MKITSKTVTPPPVREFTLTVSEQELVEIEKCLHAGNDSEVNMVTWEPVFDVLVENDIERQR